MKASTQSYIAKHMEVKIVNNVFKFTFEHRDANVIMLSHIGLEAQIEHIAKEACLRLFTEDFLGAILNERLKGNLE